MCDHVGYCLLYFQNDAQADIGRSKRKWNQPLTDLGNAIGRRMFYEWWIPKWQRLIRHRIHGSASNCRLERTNETVLMKKPSEKSKFSSTLRKCCESRPLLCRIYAV